MQDRFLAVAGPWVLSGDRVQAGVGRVQTLRGQAGGCPGQFRLVWSVCGIHIYQGRSFGSEVPENLKVTSRHHTLPSPSGPSSAGAWTNRHHYWSMSAKDMEAQQ